MTEGFCKKRAKAAGENNSKKTVHNLSVLSLLSICFGANSMNSSVSKRAKEEFRPE